MDTYTQFRNKKKDEARHETMRKQLLAKLNTQDNQFLGDFENKSILSTFDPNSPSTMNLLGVSRNQQSLFMDAIKRKLHSLKATEMTKEDIALKDRLDKLIDFMSHIRVVDARVLLKVYDLYKFKPF